MKKILLLALVAITIASCNNIEQYKERIYEISTEWEQTKSEASGIAQGLSNVLSLLNSARSTLNDYTGENSETMSTETRTQIDSLRARISRTNESIATFMQNIGSAAKPLSDNQKQMDALSAAVQDQSQEFEGNVKKTIQLLENSMEQTNSNIEEFNRRLNALRDEADAIYEEVQALTVPKEELVQ